MPAVHIDGVALDYIEKGSGPPLIFVHGGISDRRTWTRQIDAFAEQYHVIAYTRRHYHGSECATSERTSSVTTNAEDLVAVMERIAHGPAHLAGNSYGAFTCLLAAVSRPELVCTLVLGEPPVAHVLASDAAAASQWAQFASAADSARARIRAGDIDGGLRTFSDAVSVPGVFDTLPPPVRAMLRDNAASLLLERWPIEPFGAPEAAHVTMPVLLVTGERSPAFLIAITDRLQRLLRHAERVEIPAASHAMHADNAPAYNAAVMEFLSRHP